MPKEIYFNRDGSALKKLQVTPSDEALVYLCSTTDLFDFVEQVGVDLVAELVGVTLGPKGRNVVLQSKYGPPKIVNDGETVLKEVLWYSFRILVKVFRICYYGICK